MTSPLGTLGRFTLLRRLAAGGMGEVYLAEAQGAANFTRRVAIKRILPHLARDEGFVCKFIDEANLMVQLHHGNIVPVQELNDQDGELYIVMEYLPGRDLKAIIRRLRARTEQMPVDLALWLVSEVCAGLDYAHRKCGPDGSALHIVHRDVSPSNVLLGAGGEVKLADFGIARARGRLHQSISGTLQGKFIYMSPEQAEGRTVSPQSDVFSAGLVLYELLCGVRPFAGESETETLRKVRETHIDAPSLHRAELDSTLDALVLKALAREPEGRYESAATFRRALQHNLADHRSTADAAKMSQLLAQLFPEGVVPPDSPQAPLSLDDALMLQLGALTPSINPRSRTQTSPHMGVDPDGEPVTPSAPSTPSFSTLEPERPSGAFARASGTFPAVPHDRVDDGVVTPTARAGRRRWLFSGLVLGAAVAVGLTLYLSASAPAWLEPTVSPQGVEFELSVVDHGNHAALDQSTRFKRGETRRICAAAPGYTPDCRYLTFAAGANHPVFRLRALDYVTPVVKPPSAVATFSVDGAKVGPRFLLLPNRSHRVCASAPGFSERCQQYFTVPGEPTHIVFELTLSLQPDAAAPMEPVADAGVPMDAAAEAPRRTPRRALITVRSVPPGAQVFVDGRRVGVTPWRTRSARPLVLKRAGYRDHPVTARTSEVIRMVALTPGTVRVRLIPGGAKLYVDGTLTVMPRDGQLSLSAGTHRLEARLKLDDATLVSEVVRVKIVSGALLPSAIKLDLTPQMNGSTAP